MRPLCKVCAARLAAELEAAEATLHAQQIQIEEVSEELAELRMQLRQLTGGGGGTVAVAGVVPAALDQMTRRTAVCQACRQSVGTMLHYGKEVYAPHTDVRQSAGQMCGGSMMATDTLDIAEDPGARPGADLDIVERD